MPVDRSEGLDERAGPCLSKKVRDWWAELAQALFDKSEELRARPATPETPSASPVARRVVNWTLPGAKKDDIGR